VSKRETTLCDINVSSFKGNIIICDELSIATCALCRNDMCSKHALHPKGGVLLRADTIVPNGTVGQQQDLVYAPHAQQQTPYPQVNLNTPMIRLNICRGCRDGLTDTEISEALRAVEGQFVKLLAASMSAKALAK